MNSYLPSIRHLPQIYSPSPSPSPSLSSSQSHTIPTTPLPSQNPPFTPSTAYQDHHHGAPSRTEEYKTSLEQAKLDRRRQEYALLRDALRRGIPYSAIPGLLASRDPSVRKRTEDGDYGLGGGELHQHISGDRNGLSVYGHGHEQGSAHGQAGVIYYIPTPTDPVNLATQKRRLDLDDSFLSRAYKRRRPWTSSAQARSTHQRAKQQRITFHHWVPGVSK